MKQRTLKKMLKTVFALIFALTAVLTAALPDAALAASDFILTQTCNVSSLSEGDTFRIIISMKNISGAELSDIGLDFSDASDIAVLKNGGTLGDVDPALTVADGATEALGAFDMRFTGDGSTGLMPVNVTYTKAGGGGPSSAKVNLYLDVETPSTPGPAPDPDLYKPNLTATVPDGTTVTAGQFVGVKFTIKNLSTNTSVSNIVFTPVTDTIFTQAKVLTAPIDQLYTNGSAEVSLSILADKYKAAGTYPFKFKLTSKNAFGVEFTTDYTVNIDVVNNNKETRLTVQTSSADNISASAGKGFSIPVYIVNSGDFYAKDATVALTGLSQDTFTLFSGAGQFNIDRVDGNTNKKIDVKLIASKGLKSGSYPISFKLDYTTESGEKVSDTQQIWLPVTGSGDSVNSLEVVEVKPSATTVSSSDTFSVSVKLKNSGTAEADQVKISADGSASLLPVTQNLFIVPKLAPGETKTLEFKFQPSPDAKRGSVPIIIRVESDDGSGQSATLSQAVSVFINAEANASDPSKDIPKIIVGSYSYEPQLVKAGENFTLKMQFVNTHSSKVIRNIKGNFTVNETSVDQKGNVFTPVGSSNTFYIDTISPKGTHDWSLELYTIPDAQSKTYTVTISFDYEDEQGNPFKEDEIIGIPVYQPSRLEVSDISVPTDGFIGQPVYLPFNLYNMGKTTIYNVRLSVQGDFDAQPSSQYFGNFDPGYQEYVELNLNPKTVGPANGKVLIEYETPSGEVQTIEKAFTMNVQDMAAMNPGGDMPGDGGKFPVDGGMVIGPDGKPVNGEATPGGGGFFGSLLFFIILGVVVVGVAVVIILVVRKRKKEKEFDF